MIVLEPADHSPEKCQGMLSSVIVPRPIAMISTINEAGVVKVAPYSYFMPVTGEPPLLAVRMGARRQERAEPNDTWANTQRTTSRPADSRAFETSGAVRGDASREFVQPAT